VKRRALEAVDPADLVETDGPDPVRQGREGAAATRQADQPQERDPRHDPERRVETVRDRLEAVGRGGPDARPVAGRRDPGEEGSPETAALDPGPHEQHREEPDLAPHRRRREAVDRAARAARALCDHESIGIRAVEVGVEPEDRSQLFGHLGLGQAAEVVVDRSAPDSRRR
jgi:hypothetical protein